MQRLTIRQKFAAIFGVYFFAFLMVLCLIFFVIYQFLINRQIETVLFQDMQSVISKHLRVDNDHLKLTSDDQGRTLKEYFLSESISGLIFDKYNNIFKAYGVFALMDSNKSDWNEFTTLVKRNTFQDKFKTIEFPLENGKVKMLSVPITYENKQLGTLVLGKSFEEYDQAKNAILLVTATLGILGLIGSFILGYILANYAFNPVKNIIKTVEEVDLEKLDKAVQLKGNPSDELVNLSQKINKMFVKFKVMAQNQKDFILNASHELKTPMARAISTLDVISLKKNTSKVKIKKVRNDLMDINTLLDNLLSLSSLETEALPKCNSNLCQTINETIDKFDTEVDSKKLKIENIVNSKIFVNVPAQYLSIIITNIIFNAIKYSYNNSVIKINCKSNNSTTLEIEDQGIGMDQTQTRKIFKRFFRSDEAKKIHSGYGLGMSIVKQICNLYKIKISVTSISGGGTKVSLKF